MRDYCIIFVVDFFFFLFFGGGFVFTMAIKMAVQSEIDVHNILDVFNNVTKIEERKINNQVTWIILLLIGMPHYEIEFPDAPLNCPPSHYHHPHPCLGPLWEFHRNLEVSCPTILVVTPHSSKWSISTIFSNAVQNVSNMSTGRRQGCNYLKRHFH